MSVIRVATAAPYDVVVDRLGAELPAALTGVVTGALGHQSRQVGLVHADDPALASYAARVRGALSGAGLRVLDLPVPPGEAGKRADVAARCWERLGEAGLTRSDTIVTVGGGAVTDLGGFVAATWLRGIPVVHVPTTLLAMVDAAVGGKTGINTGAGKNLVGAFHEPAGVVCDLDALVTLPSVELVSGLGEVVKCGFIADPAILDLVEADPGAARDPGSPVLHELVERAIRVKADVVSGDLRETGGDEGHPGREVLNYGHTLAHALERATGYAVRHGEAVAIGACYVAEVARGAGLVDEGLAARHAAAFAAVGLPTSPPAGLDFAELLAAMRVDKKSRGDQIRLVVLHGLARPRMLAGPDDEQLAAAYAAIGGDR